MASLCSISKLPPEVVQLIFEFLPARRDRIALRSCSLTCRAWCSIAQRELFHDIHLDLFTQRAAKFEEFIRDSPIVGNYVQELNIHTISDDMEAPLTLFGLENMPNLRKLNLIQMICRPLRPLLCALRLRPALRELRLSLGNNTVVLEDDYPVDTAAARLKSLSLSLYRLNEANQVHLLDELLASGMLARLESLTLSRLGANHPIIRETSRTLVAVTIDLAEDAVLDTIIDDLALCTALHSLAFVNGQGPTAPSILFPALASRLAPALPHLQDVHIFVMDTAPRFAEKHSAAWKDAARALRGRARIQITFGIIEDAGPRMQTTPCEFAEHGVETGIGWWHE